MSGRGLVHAIFAPLCKDGTVHRISTHATLLPPEQLPALAARDDGVRAALARSLERYGACESDMCVYALIVRPAVLCPGCSVPDGGAAVLITADSEGGIVELASWSSEEDLEDPALALLDERCACWGLDECSVELSLENAEVQEVGRQTSVMLLTDGAALWTGPPGLSTLERWLQGEFQAPSCWARCLIVLLLVTMTSSAHSSCSIFIKFACKV